MGRVPWFRGCKSPVFFDVPFMKYIFEVSNNIIFFDMAWNHDVMGFSLFTFSRVEYLPTLFMANYVAFLPG